MKSNITLGIALLISGALFGCSTNTIIHPTTRLPREPEQKPMEAVVTPPMPPSNQAARIWLPATNGLQMSVTVLQTFNPQDPAFEIAIENRGAQDVMLNLGYLLANGKVQLPSRIQLQLKDSNGKVRELEFSDKRYGTIAGRVDDYLVPLRSGSNYTLELRLDQFWSPGTKEFEFNLKPGRYEVSAQFQGSGASQNNGDMRGEKLIEFWKGELHSSPFAFLLEAQNAGN